MQMRLAATAAALACAAGVAAPALRAAEDSQNNVIALLAAGKPAIGVWTGATPATRIAKVLGTSDADFIVADLEHDIYDFQALHRFLLEIADFHHRYRTQPRPMPNVLVKLAHRGGWDPRYEISEVMRVGLDGSVKGILRYGAVTNAFVGLDHRDDHQLSLGVRRPERRDAGVTALPRQIEPFEA